MPGASWPTIAISALVGSSSALAAVAVVLMFVTPGQLQTDDTASARLSQPGPEEQAREVIAWRDVQLREFNAERVAPDWATRSQEQLGARLQVLNQQRSRHDLEAFDVERIECRTSMCIASLAWNGIEQAREASTTLAGFNYRLPCATSSLVYDKPGESSHGRYRHELIFRCKASQTS